MAITKTIDICSYDVIYNKTHKVSSILKYFQQLAREDLDALGLTHGILLEQGIAFVLVKLECRFYKPIYSYDKVVVTTSHRKTKGASFIRDFAVTRQDEVICEASTYWVLIDFNTRKICRPSALTADLGEPKSLIDFEIDDKIVFEDTDINCYTYKVVFSDLDENNHMNNTRYPDICLDSIGGIPADKFVSRVRIDFLTESKAGEELVLDVFRSNDDSCSFFAKNKSTGFKCYDAIIELKNK